MFDWNIDEISTQNKSNVLKCKHIYRQCGKSWKCVVVVSWVTQATLLSHKEEAGGRLLLTTTDKKVCWNPACRDVPGFLCSKTTVYKADFETGSEKGLAIKIQIPCCSAQRYLVSCVLRTCHNAVRIHPELTSFLKVKGKWMVIKELIQSQPGAKTFNVALLWDESTMRLMPQSRNVTHRTQEEGQTGPENSLYPNILSLFLCSVMGALGLRTAS